MLLWHCCTWCSNETLLEMLIWGQWVFVLNSWVSWCFCDTVSPYVQMRLCWKCWFEGNEYLFLIPESPDAFVTLLLIWTSGATVSQKHQETQELRTNTHCPQINISNKVSFQHQVQQCHKRLRRLINKEHGLIALKTTFPTKSHLNIRCNSVTKNSGDSGIKNKYSLPSNQHFQQSLIWTSGATVSQKHQETQELRTNTHCPQINISNKVSFEHKVKQCHKSIRRLRN